MHPVFVAAYVFTGISVALESACPLSEYGKSISFALMIGGAILVASLCRDRAALKMLMYGFVGAGLWLGAYLFLTSYGALSQVATTDYVEASYARVEAFKDASIQGNLNGLAIYCVQGGVVAVAFAMGSRALSSRSFSTAIGIFCLIASSLTMSRGAIVNALISCAVLLKAYGVKQGKTWLLASLLVVSTVLLVPDAIWSRMVVKTSESEKDSRVSLYEAALQHVDDYWMMGVGTGNYYKKWGFEKGFASRNNDEVVVYGAHNAFLQVMINWGLIGLLSFVAVIWLAYRCLPRTYGQDALALGMLGVAVSLLLILPFGHDFSYKGFSLGLGMLVAYQRWLAPGKAGQLASR
jgi:hypothetical protein